MLDPSHPLDPLSPQEIQRAAAVLRAAHDLGTGMMFETISLEEPDKARLAAFVPGAPFPRIAFLCVFDRNDGRVFEARVDLRTEQILSWTSRPGVRPRILFDDILLVGRVARADPRFLAALARRGITDIEMVQVDPWSAGNYGLPDEEGRRLSHTFCWLRTSPDDNAYAHPIEGLCAVIDLDRAEVLRVDDYGVAEIPMGNRNYAAKFRETFRDDIRPLDITQPERPSFSVTGHEVHWQKWRFRVGFNAREGLTLHAITYEDQGRIRPVSAHRSGRPAWPLQQTGTPCMAGAQRCPRPNQPRSTATSWAAIASQSLSRRPVSRAPSTRTAWRVRSAAASIASARACAVMSRASTPSTPSRSCSVRPPTGVATTGTPRPCAIGATPLWLASRYDSTTASASATSCAISASPSQRAATVTPGKADRPGASASGSPSPATSSVAPGCRGWKIAQASRNRSSPL